MYFIPRGLFPRDQAEVIKVAGGTIEQLANLTWQGFLIDNLLPVTLGNIVGGGLMVAAAYLFVYLRGQKGVIEVKDESVHAVVTRRA